VKQFILAKEPDRDDTIRLEGNDYHYLVRVRRLAVGEFFSGVLPNGKETLVQILSIDPKALTGKCQASSEAASSEDAYLEAASSGRKLPSLILFQALPKGDKMDLIVRQAAEGGITEIVPFTSEYSIAKTSADGQKFTRWERIIREARQQSGSRIATAIRRTPPGRCMTIGGLFEYWTEIKETGALGLLFHHQGLEKERLHSYLDSVNNVVVMAVGPEGGFSDAEVSLFLENGFKPATIGNTVLRTETAALYCAAAVKILLLEKDSWELKQVKRSSG